MSDALLPCPFCGAHGLMRGEQEAYWAECSEAGQGCAVWPSSRTYSSETEAAKAWNRRAQSDAPAPAVCLCFQLTCGECRAKIIGRNTPAMLRAAAAPAPLPSETEKDMTPIEAQHEETGRIWHGARGDLPHRYREIQTTDATPARDALVERLNAEADAITCYASTTTEHAPNRTAMLLREAAAALEKCKRHARGQQTVTAEIQRELHEANAALAQRDVPRAEPWIALAIKAACMNQGVSREVAANIASAVEYAAPPERSAARDSRIRRPYSCDECGREFLSVAVLQAHECEERSAAQRDDDARDAAILRAIERQHPALVGKARHDYAAMQEGR